MRHHRALALLIIALILLNACAFGAGSTAPTAIPGQATGVPSAAAPAEAIGASAAPAAAGTPGSAARVTITFGAWESERAVYEAQIAAFEQDNPETHVRFVPLDSILQTVDDTRTAIGQIMSAADTAAVPMSPGAIKQG